MQKGIIVGCDAHHQEYLPLWWLTYKLHNNFPVTFMDFGMDEQGISFCKERGEVVSINDTLLADPKAFVFEEEFASIQMQQTRLAWFKKPLAFMKSPYDKTVWIDLDCMILENLLPLFDFCENETGMAIAEDPPGKVDWAKLGVIPDMALYNSGVVVFRKDSPILPLWLMFCEKSELFRGDQDILSYTFHAIGKKPFILPKKYNFIAHLIKENAKLEKDICIIHLAGTWMKPFMSLMIQETSRELAQNLCL